MLWQDVAMVTVRFYAAARAAAGTSELAMEISTVQELLEQCSGMNERLAEVISTCTFLVDGIADSNLGRNLNGAQQVDVLPKFAGG